MKKTLLAFLLSITTLFVWSQAPVNPGFESWTNIIFFDEPQGYVSSNYYSIISGAGGLPRANVFKSTDKHSGTYAIKLESYANPNDPTKGIPGLAVTAELDIPNVSIKAGFPVSSNFTSFKGYYKYAQGTEPDTAAIAVVLYKRDTNNQLMIVGAGYAFLSNQSSYTEFTGNINFFSQETADTAVIAISTSTRFDIQLFIDSLDFNAIDVPIGSVLFVDDLSFEGGINGIEKSIKLSNLLSYPNPAQSVLNIRTSHAVQGNAELVILNMLGQEVQRYSFVNTSLQNEIQIPVSKLQNGSYSFLLLSQSGLQSGKFMVIQQ